MRVIVRAGGLWRAGLSPGILIAFEAILIGDRVVPSGSSLLRQVAERAPAPLWRLTFALAVPAWVVAAWWSVVSVLHGGMVAGVVYCCDAGCAACLAAWCWALWGCRFQ